MNYRDSDKVRLLKTLCWEETDRIPNLETLFESKHVDAVLGKQSGRNSWELAPSDQLELALRTGIDMLFVGGYVLTSSHTMVNSIPFSNYETMLKTLHELCNGTTFFRRG